jgi:RNA polymerase sigma-70 factor (ECF subfamily)
MPPQLEVTVERESKAVVSRVDRDRALVEALRREPSAADDLLATYGDRACRLATRITGNPQDAEEAVQDAFWCVIRRIDTFRGESTFCSWLYRIVANAAYQKLRRRAARRRELSLDEMLPAFDHCGKHVEPVPDWSASVDDPARQTELRAALSAAIEELPPDYRAVVVLRDVEGLAHCEIGDALGLTVGNVKTRVHRARLFLRQRLERHLSPSRAEAL